MLPPIPAEGNMGTDLFSLPIKITAYNGVGRLEQVFNAGALAGTCTYGSA